MTAAQRRLVDELAERAWAEDRRNGGARFAELAQDPTFRARYGAAGSKAAA